MPVIESLKRNDIDGALALAKKLLSQGKYGPEEAQTLLMLQDDPDKLIEKLDELVSSFSPKKRK